MFLYTKVVRKFDVICEDFESDKKGYCTKYVKSEFWKPSARYVCKKVLSLEQNRLTSKMFESDRKNSVSVYFRPTTGVQTLIFEFNFFDLIKNHKIF